MSTFISTGTKPMNATILEGGASWKDRYRVTDDLANRIVYCITFLEDGKEYCLFYSNDFLFNLLTNNSEQFPIGSIAIFRDNTHQGLHYRIKVNTNTWFIIY